MKTPLLAAILLLVAVPTAHAQPSQKMVEVDTLIQTDVCAPTGTACVDPTPGIRAFLRVDISMQDPSAWTNQTSWTFWVPEAAGEPVVRTIRNEVQRAHEEGRVNKTADPVGGRQAWTVDTRGLYPDLQNGEKVSIQLELSVEGLSYDHRVAYPVESLLIFASSDESRVPSADGLTFRASSDRHHASLQNVPADETYTISFGTAPGGTLRDLNNYTWLIAGLAVGLLIAYVAARQGWFGGARARKFEKGGELESRDTLEARRRTLMAALKELELAHEAKDIPDAAYAPLKEEYKAQAVRVLRSLEEKKESPKT